MFSVKARSRLVRFSEQFALRTPNKCCKAGDYALYQFDDDFHSYHTVLLGSCCVSICVLVLAAKHTKLIVDFPNERRCWKMSAGLTRLFLVRAAQLAATNLVVTILNVLLQVWSFVHYRRMDARCRMKNQENFRLLSKFSLIAQDTLASKGRS